MSLSILYVLIILVLMLAALITDKLRPGLIMFSAVVLMLAVGILTPKEAIEGFSNKGMITVALLYLISEGVRNSGMLERIIYSLLPQKGCGVHKANFRFLPAISFLSAFLNNTPVVVIFAPMIKNWAQKMRLSPTKFLIPLSYATILGGMCTLIGTSTNLVVDGMIQDAGYEGMGMFELSKVGLLILMVGILYLVFVGPRLLPDTRKSEQEAEEGDQQPGMVRLEVMLSTRFPGLGKTLHKFDFYRHYGAHVRAIRRSGTTLQGDWMNIRLTKEDTLIVDADDTFLPTWGESRVFWMINRVGDSLPPMGNHKKYFALVLLVLMILGATFGEMPFVKQYVPGVRLDMFYFACITTVVMAWMKMFNTRKYTKFISWDVLITIACAFGISKGMINSGFADLAASYIIALAEYARHSQNGIYIMLAALYIITNLFTELITNNAAAALAFPLAVGISNQLGCDPMPFFVCICFAASASFSTPIGYQTNLIVQGVGGYKFVDFLRVGLPLNLIVFFISVFLIPLFYS
ncbi:MAG: SLC13/DASS family transporter [Bacteroidaceae bacterium]|nr:SLC13/DASS family transporter [Bacteroidaceae bacterium]